MFEMMSQYDLLLAHPSTCSDLESESHVTAMLKRQPTNTLRYTTAVDILAPLFDMAFFQDTVLHTLQNATHGMPPYDYKKLDFSFLPDSKLPVRA